MDTLSLDDESSHDYSTSTAADPSHAWGDGMKTIHPSNNNDEEDNNDDYDTASDDEPDEGYPDPKNQPKPPPDNSKSAWATSSYGYAIQSSYAAPPPSYLAPPPPPHPPPYDDSNPSATLSEQAQSFQYRPMKSAAAAAASSSSDDNETSPAASTSISTPTRSIPEESATPTPVRQHFSREVVCKDITLLTQRTAENFFGSHAASLKIVLVTKKEETPLLFQKLAERFGTKSIIFGEIKHTETWLLDQLSISQEEIPRVFAFPANGEKIRYDGRHTIDALSAFIKEISTNETSRSSQRAEEDWELVDSVDGPITASEEDALQPNFVYRWSDGVQLLSRSKRPKQKADNLTMFGVLWSTPDWEGRRVVAVSFHEIVSSLRCLIAQNYHSIFRRLTYPHLSKILHVLTGEIAIPDDNCFPSARMTLDRHVGIWSRDPWLKQGRLIYPREDLAYAEAFFQWNMSVGAEVRASLMQLPTCDDGSVGPMPQSVQMAVETIDQMTAAVREMLKVAPMARCAEECVGMAKQMGGTWTPTLENCLKHVVEAAWIFFRLRHESSLLKYLESGSRLSVQVWQSRDYVAYLLENALTLAHPNLYDHVNSSVKAELPSYLHRGWCAPLPPHLLTTQGMLPNNQWLLHGPLDADARKDEYQLAVFNAYFISQVQNRIDSQRYPQIHIAIRELLGLTREYASECCSVLRGAPFSPFAPLYLAI